MDAGHGSVLNVEGEVEMDAIITDGCMYTHVNVCHMTSAHDALSASHVYSS